MSRRRITRRLSSIVYDALKLPEPEDAELGLSSEPTYDLGTLALSSIEDAIPALVRAFKSDTGEPYFLPFADYCHAVAGMDRIRGQIHRLDSWMASDTSSPMPQAPQPGEEAFADFFSRERHSPDLAGYIAYLETAAPELAAILSQPQPVHLPEKARERHTYVLAATGGGKTEFLKVLLHSYMQHPKSGAVVILEPAGEFVEQVAHWKEFRNSDRLVYVDPRLASGMTPTINPFEISGVAASDVSEGAIRTKQVVAQQLLAALQEVIGGGVGGTLTLTMEALLTPCILTLLDLPGANIRELARFMDDDHNADLVELGASRSHYPDAARFFQTRFLTDKRYAVTKGSIATKLQLLLSTGVFANLTCGPSTIDLERCLQERKVILFNLGKGSVGAEEGSAFGRLIVAMIQGMAMRRSTIPKSKRVSCHLILDECHNYVTASVGEMLREARKYRFMLTLCQQLRGDGMDPRLASTVTGNTLLKIGGQAPERASQKATADLLHVDPSRVAELGQGQFLIRYANNPTFQVQAPSHLLDFANAMAPPLWNRVKKLQLRRYYRPEHVSTDEFIRSQPEPPTAPKRKRRKLV